MTSSNASSPTPDRSFYPDNINNSIKVRTRHHLDRKLCTRHVSGCLQAALKGLEDLSRSNTHLPPLEPGEVKAEVAPSENRMSHVGEEELLRRMTQEHAQRMRHRNGEGDASVAMEMEEGQDDNKPQDLRLEASKQHLLFKCVGYHRIVLSCSSRATAAVTSQASDDSSRVFTSSHEPLPQLNSVARYQYPSHVNGDVPSPEEVNPHPLADAQRGVIEVTPCAPEEDDDEEIPREWDNAHAQAWRGDVATSDGVKLSSAPAASTEVQ